MEEIQKGLYRVELPLPGNPLKNINSYFLLSEQGNLIIDTGMNRPECCEVLEAAIRDLNVDLTKTDVLITHMHADHSGQAFRLTAAGARRILCSQEDGESIVHMSGPEAAQRWERLRQAACRIGFPPDEAVLAVNRHPGNVFGPTGQFKFEPLAPGTILEVGPFRLRIYITPGHSDGHICLYDENAKILFSGDHILGDITPNITAWNENKNSLGQYLCNLEVLEALDAALVLPGHRNIFRDHRQRIEELRCHHTRRLQETLNLLSDEPLTAYQVAAGMKWDLTFKNWNEFPAAQKWFATGEAAAHLIYLLHDGRAECSIAADGIVRWTRPADAY